MFYKIEYVNYFSTTELAEIKLEVFLSKAFVIISLNKIPPLDDFFPKFILVKKSKGAFITLKLCNMLTQP